MPEQPRGTLEDAPQPIQQSLAWSLDSSVPGIQGADEDLKGSGNTGGCRGQGYGPGTRTSGPVVSR